MAFRLIVDDRVADTSDTLDDAVRFAAEQITRSPQASVQIVYLSGGIYNRAQVVQASYWGWAPKSAACGWRRLS